MGRIGGPHGIRGALKVQSFADPPESLLQYRSWHLRRADGGEEPYEVLQSQWDGHALRVELEGIRDRDAAALLCNREILIERERLPAPAPGEFFRDDLQGFAVCNVEGVTLGTLLHFLDAPAGALMVVSGDGGTTERWLPATPPFIRRVDPQRRVIEIDWPADF
ncbi:MAG TPA: ribosome maturation factor RimM [Steroidobacteraceae bacterium]|nr:ribosome maturation factor RimM [Steroidobacteraceae bacterium]